MQQLASLADVKRVLHRDANDTSIDDALTAALEVASLHITLYTKQNWAQAGVQNTYTIYDRPEDGKLPMPVAGATVNQIRFYRTPTSTAYTGKPLIDYEIVHDGLTPPANMIAQAGGGTGTLVPTTRYYYVVTALNPAGETNGSQEAAVTMPAGVTAATIAWQAYGGEVSYNVYRTTVQGTQTTNPTCFVANVAAGSLPITPGGTGSPISVSYIDTGTATSTGSVPTFNATVTVPARSIRLHPTVFDIPFEGAVSQHYPDNWSRVEIDYTPPLQIPPSVRDSVALTAGAIFTRGPVTVGGLQTESMGGYSWSVKTVRGQAEAVTDVIPEVAKALLRPFKRRGPMTT